MSRDFESYNKKKNTLSTNIINIQPSTLEKTLNYLVIDADEHNSLKIEFNSKLPSKYDINVVTWFCELINSYKVNLDDPIAKEKFLNKLQSQTFSKLPNEFVNNISEFILNWGKIKKQRTHELILENPSKHRIVRPVEEHQFTTIHFFTRNQVFQILGKQERAKKTRIDDFGKVIDIPESRSFLGWGGNGHFEISGSVLCTYDQEVFDACIKLWHEKYEAVGIILKTNLSEIWAAMGNKSKINSRSTEVLKRSLDRLVKCTISAKSLENKSFWSGGIIDDVCYREATNTKNNHILISFNKYMVKHYLDGAYAILSHPIYQCLTPYAKKIYLFLMSHSEKMRKMGIEKWREPLGVNSNVPTKELKRNINNANKELINFNVLDPSSYINNKNEVCTLICDDAWQSKPIFISSKNISNQIVL